jgi:hypothetical protein
MFQLTVTQADVDEGLALVRKYVEPLSCGCALTMALKRHLGTKGHTWTSSDSAGHKKMGEDALFYRHDGRELVEWFDTHAFNLNLVDPAPVPCVVTFTEQDHM